MLAETFKHEHSDQTYVVDSLPVAVCDNIRIRRCKLYPPQEHGEAFRGYIASKRRYFYGLRVHLVVSGRGEPVEFSLAAASEADVKLLKELGLDLPEGSIIYADKGYTDYHYEDLLEEVGLHLKAQRKKRSKRPMPAWEEFLSKPIRQYIETVFSGLSALFARKIHAVTPRGFELKIVLLPVGLLHSMPIACRGQLRLVLEKLSDNSRRASFRGSSRGSNKAPSAVSAPFVPPKAAP